MLGRKLAASASFVCLRCRFQLAGTTKRLPFPAVAVSPVRNPRRYLGTHGTPTATDEPNERDDGETRAAPDFEIEPFNEGSNEGANGSFAHYRAPAPPNRRYRSRGHELSPAQEGLPIGILGKPGSAIIMRERKMKKKLRDPAQPESEATANSRVDMARLLPAKRTDATTDEAQLNIHELKPAGTQILSENEFMMLKDTLMEGFTSSQLMNYMKEYRVVQQQLAQVDTDSSKRPPWLLELRPWVPAVENAVPDVGPQLDGYITSDMTRKERLAMRLMRECWDLSYQEIQDRHGYLSLKLRDKEFSLLTIGNKRWLEGAPRGILKSVKQVRLIHESRFVSIMAPKHAAESILDRINRVLTNARTTEFAADLVSSKPLDPSVLEELGRTTNALIRLNSSGKKVVVSWIHKTERDENFENIDETILRFLRDAYGPKFRQSSALEVVPSGLTHRGRYLEELNCGEKLPWQERFNKWERWTAAVAQPGPYASARRTGIFVPAEILPFAIGSEAVRRPHISIDSPEGWSPELQTKTSAVFGHVVFARQKQASTSIPTAQPTPALDTLLPRTFVPLLPALGSLNLGGNLREEGLWHTKVVIRFTPSPNLPEDVIKSAPDLELGMEADHREVKRLTHLHAITDTFAGDVLFPEAAVDARLLQRRYFALPGSSIEHHAPQIVSFLSKSDLRPRDGKLNTPPSLPDIRLPRRLLSPIVDTPATEQDDTDLVTINYSLASIELRRTLSAQYEGLKLRYTNIQAGQRGGERAELSLEAVRVGAGADQPPPAAPYDLVDDTEDTNNRSQFVSHILRDAEQAAAAEQQPESSSASAAANAVSISEFLRVTCRIVDEKGILKWHARPHAEWETPKRAGH